MPWPVAVHQREHPIPRFKKVVIEHKRRYEPADLVAWLPRHPDHLLAVWFYRARNVRGHTFRTWVFNVIWAVSLHGQHLAEGRLWRYKTINGHSRDPRCEGDCELFLDRGYFGKTPMDETPEGIRLMADALATIEVRIPCRMVGFPENPDLFQFAQAMRPHIEEAKDAI